MHEQHLVLSSPPPVPPSLHDFSVPPTRNAQIGSYIMQPHKLRDFVVPDLTGFKACVLHTVCRIFVTVFVLSPNSALMCVSACLDVLM